MGSWGLNNPKRCPYIGLTSHDKLIMSCRVFPGLIVWAVPLISTVLLVEHGLRLVTPELG